MIALHRNQSNKNGTFGLLIMDGQLLAYTIELPWRDNRPNISCIPKGTYKVVKRNSAKYGDHWHLQDVVDRSLILIHHGNWAKDTEGCILVGDRYLDDEQGIVNGVGNSVATMNKLRVILPDEFNITIL